MKKMKKGFTLIELMIVVAIIGVLAAVAIPKFADLIRKAQEAACKGQLGAIRSALSIYYGSEEGWWPQIIAGADTTAFAGCMAPTYLQAIPNAKPGSTGGGDSPSIMVVVSGTVGAVTNVAGWWYNCGTTNSGGAEVGTFKVNSAETDTKGTGIHMW